MPTAAAPATVARATAYRPFLVQVARTQRLSPTFVRITVTGADLHQLDPAGLDQRIKLVLPLPEYGLPSLDEVQTTWQMYWRSLPEHRRNPVRTYTIRAARPHEAEVDVDVVLHPDGGPASRWAETAAPGDEIVIVGPNLQFAGYCGGTEWDPPAAARTLLLAGDETAAPAICSIIEGLPPGRPVRALIEVPLPDDALDVTVGTHVELTWLPRTDGAVTHDHGVLLEAAVRDAVEALTPAGPGVEPEDVDIDRTLLWDVPERGTTEAPTGLYCWVAGEASVVRSLRRYLVRDVGLDRSAVAFMGYWRRGRAESG